MIFQKGDVICGSKDKKEKKCILKIKMMNLKANAKKKKRKKRKETGLASTLVEL